jgi:hypothetical protein
MKIDNFALTMHQTCPAKYNLRIKERWTSRYKSGALGFGASLHSGLAEWYRTGDVGEALRAIDKVWPEEMPSDDYRTKEKCLRVMAEYIRQYPKESFQIVGAPENPLIEVPFTLDTGLFTDSGEPIEYGGIFDGLIEFGDNVYILEHKSTSQLGSYYFNQYKPNNQVTGYVWAAGLLSGRRVGGAIINAVGVYKSGATKFERQITTRTQAEIDEWLVGIKETCNEIEAHERKGIWPMRTMACTLYGQCEFHSIHSLAHDKERVIALSQNYIKDQWNHEARDE